MAKEIVTQGEDFVISQDTRSYTSQSPAPELFRASGTTGKLTTGGTPGGGVYGSQGPTGAKTLLAGNPFVPGVVTGRATPGAITLTGALPGDLVVMATNMTTPANAATLFESTITIAGQIQQTSATDLSASKFQILTVHQ